MAVLMSYRRVFALACVVALAFTGMIGWLAHLQLNWLDSAPRGETENADVVGVARPSRRGSILDCRGTVLAMSVPVKVVCANPSLIFTQHIRISKTLAPLLGMEENALLPLILPRVRTNLLDGRLVTNSYVVLKRKVPLDTWHQITQAMAQVEVKFPGRRLNSSQKLAWDALRYKAIFSAEDYLRHYPGGCLGAHVLGYVSSVETNTDHGPVIVERGLSGIEMTCDHVLAGVNGWTTPSGRMAPKDGLNVVLTLDAAIQAIVEDELALAVEKYSASGGCAIVVRPFTGDILAMASVPTFDPNSPGRVANAWRNRAISDLIEPGSTFKIVTITACLEHGILSLDDTVDCERGRWWYGGMWLHDVHPLSLIHI
ncbi:MAG: penicillin-binding transpeptidase domain-containing protein, partial [Verrucomicrobiae bacterium]|nr:penicillin-binding transpeptidase domain-containing protein [Verrucomicrobiae bacterium]